MRLQTMNIGKCTHRKRNIPRKYNRNNPTSTWGWGRNMGVQTQPTENQQLSEVMIT